MLEQFNDLLRLSKPCLIRDAGVSREDYKPTWLTFRVASPSKVALLVGLTEVAVDFGALQAGGVNTYFFSYEAATKRKDGVIPLKKQSRLPLGVRWRAYLYVSSAVMHGMWQSTLNVEHKEWRLLPCNSQAIRACKQYVAYLHADTRINWMIPSRVVGEN